LKTGHHVVVINDDPVTLRTITRLLEKRNYQISPFERGEDALRALADGLLCDLVVVDLYMPGIDGWQVCRLLRSAELPGTGGIPILVVSATFSGAEVIAITEATGANAFLSVPFNAEDLYSYVTDLLAGTRPETRKNAVVFSLDDGWGESISEGLVADGYDVVRGSLAAERLHGVDLVVWDDRLPREGMAPYVSPTELPRKGPTWLVPADKTDIYNRLDLLALGVDLVVPRSVHPELLPDLAASVGRERSVLRVEDILEKRAKELQLAEDQYGELFHAFPDVVLVVDQTLLITDANDAAEAKMAPAGGEIGRRSLLALIDPKDVPSVLSLVRGVVEGAEPSKSEIRVKDGKGNTLVVEFTVRALSSRSDRYLMVGRDLTDRKAAEAASRTLEARIRGLSRSDSLRNDNSRSDDARSDHKSGPVTESQVTDGQTDARGRRGTVLVVDDETTIQSLVGRILKRFGFEVLLAGDGREGVEVFREYNHEICAVLLDRTMPVLGGDEAMALMREINPQVPIVLSSGDLDDRRVPGSPESLADAQIGKPYGPSELVDTLLAVLGEAPLEGVHGQAAGA